MTIHITPEPEFSYVSFESNVAASNYGDLISRVIKLFQPSKFLVTIFVSKVSHKSNEIIRSYIDTIYNQHIIQSVSDVEGN